MGQQSFESACASAIEMLDGKIKDYYEKADCVGLSEGEHDYLQELLQERKQLESCTG